MPSPGTIVGDKYRLEEPIGQGGMATVWRAIHTTLDRPVAVKFLEAVGTHAKQLAARFLQEAKLAAGLRHRHVVDILDFGVTDEGQPFMVMELLVGKSLADRYVEGPRISEWALVEIVAMTLGGLAAVHDAGILHRDLKPENIFLVEDADGTYPKLIDFGVSKGFQQGDRMTRTGAVVGTPEYMSSEQARGLKQIGPESDLWAIGIVLYEALVGETPFESENPGDVLIAVATEDPRPIGERRPDLPAALVEVIHRALQKKPEDRYPNARAMREALFGVIRSDAPIEGRPDERSSFGPAPGSGLIRVVSAIPPPRPSHPSAELAVPLVAKLPAEARELRKQTPTTEEHVLEALPKPLPLPPRPPKRRGWLAPTLGLLVIAGGGLAFYLLDGMTALERAGVIEARVDDGVAQGALRPGRDVSALTEPAEDDAGEETPEVSFDPPPTDGVAAPGSETIDVPSPPDPPADIEELDEEDVEAEAEPAPATTGRVRRRRPRAGR